MSILVITVIGTDRAGLVSALAGVVADHEGNWTRSQLAELAGAFAGIVVVEVPDARVAAFTAAALAIDGLEVVVQGGQEAATPTARQVTLEVLGNDRPGIGKEISRVVARHGLSILELPTDTVDSLHERIKIIERELLPDVVEAVVTRGVVTDGRKAHLA